MKKLETNREINEERLICINGRIGNNEADELVNKLDELNKTEGEVFLKINSMGGSFSAFRRIYDNFRFSRNPIIGIVVGESASGGLMALQSCTERYATINSRLLAHHTSWPVEYVLYGHLPLNQLSSQIKKDYRLVRMNEEMMMRILVERLKSTPAKVKKILDEEKFYLAEEALQLKMIDGIWTLK